MTRRMLAAIAALVIGVAGAGLAAPAMSQTKLTYSSFTPAAFPVNAIGIDGLARTLAARTGGRVTLETFYGGSMGGPQAALNSVRDGVVDSAFINPLYMPTDLPVSALLADRMYGDLMVMAGAENETALLHCPECQAEFERHNVKPLAYYSSGSFALICRKPVATLEEVKGLKVRAAGPWVALTTQLGGVPINMTTANLYEGMQRGQLDCTMGPPAFLESYKLKEVSKSVIDASTGVFHGIAMFNLNLTTWNKLTPADRDVIRGEMPSLIRRIAVKDLADAAEARKVAESSGIQFLTPDPAFKTAVDRFFRNDSARLLAKARDAKIANAETLLARLDQNIAKWEKIVAEIGGDPDKYQQALEREIFSKLR